MAGIFITFEGVEGCGKTTQIQLAADCLRGRGYGVVLTREPGGTAIGEKIRHVLLDSTHAGMAPITELLLYAAARHQHVEEVILPALKAGKVVLCDRYADATTAYQGAARNIDLTILDSVHRIATAGLMPKLTILLDCPAKTGLARARARNKREAAAGGQDRFERERMKFHEDVRRGYLAIANAEHGRVSVVDSTQEIEAVHREIIKIINVVLKDAGRGT